MSVFCFSDHTIVIQVWNIIRVSKWWLFVWMKFYFWVNYPLRDSFMLCIVDQMKSLCALYVKKIIFNIKMASSLRCVMKMDHHCPWINNCCGHMNHAYFTSFLLLAPLGCIHAALIFIMTTYTQLYDRVGVFSHCSSYFCCN